jgi:hypothetical protein
MQPAKIMVSSFYSSTDKLIDYISKGRYKTSCFQFSDIINPELANAAVASLKGKFFDYGGNFKDRRRGHLYACNDGGISRLYHKIKFDKNHVPELVGKDTNWPEAALQVVNIALKRFGQELKLVGTHDVGISFVKTRISQIGTGNFKWHTDRETSWTMRTLLSEPNDLEKGWTGGEISRSTYYLHSDRNSKENRISIAQPKESVKVHVPVFGGSILFHNINAMHLDREMNPRKEDTRTKCIELEINLKDGENKGFFETPYIVTGEEVPMDVHYFKPGDRFI